MAGKKKILLMSDDLRMHSGIATQSKEFVMGTMKHYDWVQIAGAVKHPEQGKIVNMDETLKNEAGVEDAKLTIYPISGYGNQELLRTILVRENPDAILHYTDPRFWRWLYEMEHEIRQEIPIFYYNIWDDWPAPHYNEFFYESCDLIMNISKQTVAIVNDVWKKNPPEDWQVTYLPHGVNENYFKPISIYDKEYEKVNIPMLPVTHGDAYTRLHIVFYTLLLTGTTFLPYAIEMSGLIYLTGVVILNIIFLYYVLRMYWEKSNKLAMPTFTYSIVYLMLLFAFLLVDKYADMITSGQILF